MCNIGMHSDIQTLKLGWSSLWLFLVKYVFGVVDGVFYIPIKVLEFVLLSITGFKK
jgi:hypothetical protein